MASPTIQINMMAAPMMMQQPMMQQAPQPASMDFDIGRTPSCQPGRLLYSAKFNREKLKCFYFCNCYFCPTETVNRTYLDVYSHAVVVNVPLGCCCGLCVLDQGRILHFDDPIFTEPPVKGGICSPAPHLCPHCCDFCGETLVFRRGCCGCWWGMPLRAFHWFSFGFGPCLCPADVIAGLKDGEGEKLQNHLDMALHDFRLGKREIVHAGSGVVERGQVAPGSAGTTSSFGALL